MAKLDNYLERKAVALADRKQDWATIPLSVTLHPA
jgi:hypothetical protein